MRYSATVCLLILALAVPCTAAAPVVSNVTAHQDPDSKMVNIYYNLSDPDTAKLFVSVQVSNTYLEQSRRVGVCPVRFGPGDQSVPSAEFDEQLGDI